MINEFKSVQRRIRFRTCNKTMLRRRLDIPKDAVDMLNPEFLSKFTSETGKILPRRVTGVSAKMHRKITREIRRARAVNLLP
ncbi:ribosomal protein s18 [Akkermansia glycaniphila]|uniref:Ribosomal protein s18 n=2 Tax=Akkermansia glycaniphila TaxID=1679444 RepID=A0A1H6LVR3_9BACT|nr:30S ribosomal protein S18 [Akkermansia glycaniphila]MBT9450691.1 30S ribosomal protein S18 [Akkermansia glycaniphila]SEH90570.1 ribosomal protein s18 [Akkermansia glycaniphila]